MLPSTTTYSPVAVLLVMLPPPMQARGTASCAATADLATLQQQIGSAVQVLLVDETTYPTVVHSFAPTQLPTCVLVYQGVELWRQPGLPTAHDVVAALHSKVETLSQ
jgi:hypothetical protein